MRQSNGHTTIPGAGSATHGLSQRLAEWRKTHRAPSPIPAELWAEAVELATGVGVGPTARALRLDYASLKRRVQESTAGAATPAAGNTAKAAPAFMEWLVPSVTANGSISECALEVESAHGGRLRIHLKNLAPAGLATILKEFAG